MDLIGVFVREVVMIAGYMLLFAGVYKLFQISTDLGQIKQLLKDRAPSAQVPPAFPPQIHANAADLRSSDEASEYAAKLLRAVNAESQSPAPVVSPIRPENR